MNLSRMASYVTTKVRQTDAASIARAKDFLKQRYEMIWNEALWRASVFRHDFTFQPNVAVTTELPFGNQWCNGGGVQCLPSTVDRVLALRREDAGVDVTQMEELFRNALDEFDETGVAMKFAVLPPAAVDLSRYAPATIELFHAVIESDATDAGQAVRVKLIDTDGEEQTETATLLAAANAVIAAYPLAILSATKQTTNAAVTFVYGDNADTLFSIAATETQARRYPRIRLLPRPTVNTDFKCLVKKKATPLEADNDEPELIGVENALMAFAQGDLLQYARQYGKSQAVATEALALLEQFKRMEVVQQAHRCQITPDVDEMSGDWENSKAWYA